MREVYQIASKRAVASQERSKQAYDKRVRHTALEPGDRVLVRNLRERGGPRKLRYFWENKVYKVTKRMGEDSPGYQVIPESAPNAAPRVLHCNLMLPCDDLPLEQPVRKQKRVAYTQREKLCNQVSMDLDNDDDELILYVTPDTQLPETSDESDEDSDHIGPKEPISGSTGDLDSSLASTEAPSTPSTLPCRPQRIGRQPGVLQYTKFGQPSSLPVCNIVQAPQRLALVYCLPQYQPRLTYIMPVSFPY